jgi:hypothetical protein
MGAIHGNYRSGIKAPGGGELADTMWRIINTLYRTSGPVGVCTRTERTELYSFFLSWPLDYCSSAQFVPLADRALSAFIVLFGSFCSVHSIHLPFIPRGVWSDQASIVGGSLNLHHRPQADTVQSVKNLRPYEHAF